jgi:hypothetical protein
MGPPQLGQTWGNSSARCSVAEAVGATEATEASGGADIAGGVTADAGGVGGSAGVSSSNACGAYFCKKPSYKALIANRMKIPGINQFLESRMYRPSIQITTCKLRHGPTSLFFGSLLPISAPPVMKILQLTTMV